jgi:hypothetical protein
MIYSSVGWLLLLKINPGYVFLFFFGIFLGTSYVININIETSVLGRLSNNQLRIAGSPAGYTPIMIFSKINIYF